MNGLQPRRSMTPARNERHAGLTCNPIATGADPVVDGRFNRLIGWLLMAAAFLCAAWWDPAAFQNVEHLAAPENRQIVLRHAQTMLLEIAFLQLITAQMVALPDLSIPVRRRVACLTALGAVISALGYITASQWTSGLWLIVLGSSIGARGFTSLALAGLSGRSHQLLRVIASIVCFGMLLEASATLIELQWIPSGYLGPQDGIRLRLLRLARVAALALPVLTFLYRELVVDLPLPLARRGMVAMLCGTLGMPAVLTAASLTYVEIKALLPIPSAALLAGTLCAAWLATKRSRSLELWGWLLIAVTMAGGMIMGLYAFLMPAAAPQGLAEYNDEMRRLIRLGHGYAIVFGLLQILVARELSKRIASAGIAEFGVRLLLAAGFVTNATILSLSILDLPRAVLAIGPALAALSILTFVGLQEKVSPRKFAFPLHGVLGGES